MPINNQSIDNPMISIEAYSVSDDVEKELKNVLEALLNEYNIIDMQHPLYTCIKELLINAIKANFKNIYFEDYSTQDPSKQLLSYEVAIKLFMLEMTREEAQNLERLARKKDIKARISIWIKDDFLNFSIHNPVPMTEIEQKNVEKKIEIANRLNDISEYFMEIENDPHKEGAGLGLVLITMMLKGLFNSNESLNIKTDTHGTTASIRVPLNKQLPKELHS